VIRSNQRSLDALVVQICAPEVCATVMCPFVAVYVAQARGDQDHSSSRSVAQKLTSYTPPPQDLTIVARDRYSDDGNLHRRKQVIRRSAKRLKSPKLLKSRKKSSCLLRPASFVPHP